MEKDLTEVAMKVNDCYREFIFSYVVTKNANATDTEMKALIERTEGKVQAAENVFNQIEKALANEKGDDVRYILATIKEYREAMQEFRNVYGINQEPNR